MNLILVLAWRNLWRNKRRTAITVASVFFAVLLAINAESFQRGSYEMMIDNMVKYSTGYLQLQDVLYDEEPSVDNTLLYDEELIELLKPFERQIDYTVPRLQGFTLVATSETTRGAFLIGMEPDKELKFNDLLHNLESGEFIDNDDTSVVLSSGLARVLNASVGDTLVFISQGFQGASAAGMYPVKGIVRIRVPDLDRSTILMPLKEAQWFFQAEDRLSSLIMMPGDPSKTDALAMELRSSLDAEWFRVLTWKQLLEDFLKLMAFDVAGNKLFVYILYMVIAFGIFGTVMTMMVERTKELAMVISLGMKRFQLSMICVTEMLIMIVLGVIAGALAALPVVYYFHYNPIQLTGDLAQVMLDYGFEPVMPFSINPVNFISQGYVVFVISVLIGLYPIYRIYRLNMVESSKL
jgi:putative ABC transport system permease protein